MDVGGTFTDFVLQRNGALEVYKLPSTPAEPERVVLEGLRGHAVAIVGHGTTAATNAAVEGRGATTALLTTAGFEDLLQIGRQHRPRLYDFRVTRPDPLVPRERTFGVRERVDPHGEVLHPLQREAVEALLTPLQAQGVESVAVSFLFAFANPVHEALVAEVLGDQFHVSQSSEVLPEFREFERTSTTVLDALVAPLVQRYLSRLAEGLAARLFVMRSNGGLREAQSLVRRPVEMILSGPAGGVAGAQFLGETLDLPDLLVLDMGGTSADVSLLVDGRPTWTTEAEIGGHPLALPVLDIVTIGAGGGSVAWVDPGGALRVGPRSAGADPGPLCYGRGGEALTLTDVDLTSGLLGPALLGGKMPLHPEEAERGVQELSATLGLKREDLLLGVRAVVVSNMVRAAALAFARRGLDPREFALVAFGGAGPMHAVDVARELGIATVVVPPLPGAFSAYGILVSDVRLDYGRSLVRPFEAAGSEIEAAWGSMEDRAVEELGRQGVDPEEALLVRSLDLRYQGQSYEINVPASEEIVAAFHTLHEARYGYAMPGEPVEVVNVRLGAVAARPKPLPRARGDATRGKAEREVLLANGWETVPVHPRESLPRDFVASGPLIIEEETATTVVDGGAEVRLDPSGALRLEVG